MYSTKLLLITICLDQISFTCTCKKARKRHDMCNKIPWWKIWISFAIVDPFLTWRLLHLSLSWTFAAGRWHFLFLSDRKLKGASRECKWVSQQEETRPQSQLAYRWVMAFICRKSNGQYFTIVLVRVGVSRPRLSLSARQTCASVSLSVERGLWLAERSIETSLCFVWQD